MFVIYFHIVVLLFSCIPLLCNAMDSAVQQLVFQQHLALEHNLALSSQDTKQDTLARAVAFPTDDMVVEINHDGWSTFCAKTGKQMVHVPRERTFIDFCLSKNGKKLAIIDEQKLHVYCLKTGDILYSKPIAASNKGVAFFADNETVLIFDRYGRFINICTSETEQIKNLLSKMTVIDPMYFSSHPIEDEFFITNYGIECSKYHAIMAVDKEANVVIKKLIGNNDYTFDGGVYNPNGEVIAINDRRKGCQFYSVKGDYYFLTINSNQNALLSSYAAIAFHPKKSFAALANKDDNSIEFWDYTKKTEKPLAIIPLKRIGEISSDRGFLHSVAFSPSGDQFVAMSRYGNNCYIIPTPQAAYCDENTKTQCVFINWAIKNATHFTIPNDITQLIIKNVSRLSDFHLLTPKIKEQKRKELAQHSFCIIS